MGFSLQPQSATLSYILRHSLCVHLQWHLLLQTMYSQVMLLISVNM
jgi:hypothetical protein